MSKINQLAARHTEKLNYKVNMGMFDLLINLDEQIKNGMDGRNIVPIKKSIINKMLVDNKCDHIIKEINNSCIFATLCLYRDKNNFIYIGSYNLKFHNKPEIYYCKNIEYVKTYNIDLIPYFRSNCNNKPSELTIYRNNCISINCKYNTNALSIKNCINVTINKKFAQYNNLRFYDKSEKQGYNSIKNFDLGNNYIDNSSDDEAGRPNIGDIIKAKEFKPKDDRYSIYYHTKTFNKGEPITYSSDEDMGRDDIYRVNDDVEKEIRLYEKYLGSASQTHKDKDRRKYLNKLIVAYNNKMLSDLEKKNLNKFNKIYKMDDQ